MNAPGHLRQFNEKSQCFARWQSRWKVYMGTAVLSKEIPLCDVPDGITLAHAVVDSVRDPLLVLDQNLRVIAVSRSFLQTFQLTSENVNGHLLYDIDDGQWNIPELRAKLDAVLRD